MRRIAILLLLLLPLAYAEYDMPIFKGWVLSDEPFTISNESYRAVHMRQTNTSIVYLPNGVAVVISPSNRCVYQGIYSICEAGQKFEKAGESIPYDANDRNINVSLYLIINITDIRLSFTRNFNASEIYVGDIIDVVTTINKSSAFDIFNVTLKDTYPRGFDIVGAEICRTTHDSVIWYGDMMGRVSRICTYRIRANTPGKFDTNSTLSYVAFGKIEQKKTTKTLMVLDSPLQMQLHYVNRTYFAGDYFFLSISLKTTKDVIINSLNITLPKEFYIINGTGFNVSDNTLSYRGSMNANSSKTHNIVVSTGHGAIHFLNITLDYTYQESSRMY